MSLTNISSILLQDGTIMVCGNNQYSQLGIGKSGTGYNKNMFTKIEDISNVKQIVCGGTHTILLLNDGTVMSCGYNNNGQLGLGDDITRSTFTQVSGVSNVKQISCGDYHTLILLEDGTLMSCGLNSSGQLGLGDNTKRSTFTKVPDISNVKQISCGSSHTFILLNDGTVMSCGNNQYGRLGLGNSGATTNRSTFTKVPDISNVKHISCGDQHSLILLNDDTLMSCGNNSYRQLGLGDITYTSTFTKIPDVSNVKQILCGDNHTFILLNDGTIMSCGRNTYGQLGLDDTTNRNIFTKIPYISNVKQIACGDNHTFISLQDSTLMSCGYNISGQLGLGDSGSGTNRSTFTKVPHDDITEKTIKNLINKKSERYLYTIDINKQDLLQGVTTVETLDFSEGFQDESLITTDTQYGKPIDKIDDTFSLYKTLYINGPVDLFY